MTTMNYAHHYPSHPSPPHDCTSPRHHPSPPPYHTSMTNGGVTSHPSHNQYHPITTYNHSSSPWNTIITTHPLLSSPHITPVTAHYSRHHVAHITPVISHHPPITINYTSHHFLLTITSISVHYPHHQSLSRFTLGILSVTTDRPLHPSSHHHQSPLFTHSTKRRTSETRIVLC